MEFLIALFGAVVFEAVHWYELRERLSEEKVRQALRSTGYWVITVGMILLSATGAVLFGGELGKAQLAVAGAAFPALFTKAVSAFKPETIQLGGDATLTLDEFFR
jgi:hypothetical protein